MTVHSAKGLEFTNVFVVGMEENLFPRSMVGDSPRALEEERRMKTLNDVAALYAEGLQNGWAHPLDVRSWCCLLYTSYPNHSCRVGEEAARLGIRTGAERPLTRKLPWGCPLGYMGMKG